MTDISDKPRKFKVWLDYGYSVIDPKEEVVEVPAGEDADKLCEEVLAELIGNNLDTGWHDVDSLIDSEGEPK